jgi:hypothetical protein
MNRTVKAMIAICFIIALLVFINWTHWHNGKELSRSSYRHYTVIIKKVPRQNNLHGFLSISHRIIDSKADGFYRYQIAICSDWTGSTPITSRSFEYNENNAWQNGIDHFRWNNLQSVKINMNKGYSMEEPLPKAF